MMGRSESREGWRAISGGNDTVIKRRICAERGAGFQMVGIGRPEMECRLQDWAISGCIIA